MLRSASLLGLPVLLGCSLLGCGGDEELGTVVVGVTSDLQAGGDVDAMAIEMKVDGAVVNDTSVALPGDLRFPAELSFDSVRDDATLELTMRGFDGEEPRIVRHLETRAPAGGGKSLARVHLQSACKLFEPAPGDSDIPAPSCNETTQTCINGQCRDAFVHPSTLEPYSDGWSEVVSDACKPAGGGEPVVLVGQGQTDYFKAEDYELAEVEAGPQGGHHIWVAARIKNLNQSGSITSVSGEIPDLGLQIDPLKVVFTMDIDEGGYCKLYGLRFQIDIGGDEVETMLGKTMKVKVSITDPSGTVGVGERWVTLSEDIL